MNTLLLSKVLTQLILPPGGLIVLIAVGLFFHRRRWGLALVWLSLAGLWLLSTEPVRDALTGSLEFRSMALDVNKISENNAAIVLLGGGVYAQAPEYDGRDELRSSAMMRTVYAARIARQTGLPVFATGGKVLSHDVEAEGDVMRRWLLYFGVQEAQVHSEAFADNTWQNAVKIRQMLQTQGVSRVLLVTSAWHMPRARWCFEQQGLYVIAAPTDYLTKQEAYDLRSYVPHWGVLADSATALHEYLGLFWYRLRYA
ncbi:MAG: YdcF family protein [Mariprofundaceae bacterium]